MRIEQLVSENNNFQGISIGLFYIQMEYSLYIEQLVAPCWGEE